MKKQELGFCQNCQENSVKVKCYEKTNMIKRVEYCGNKGCGYSLELPPILISEEGVVGDSKKSEKGGDTDV